ncbi:ABC transporter permease [Rhodoligotrophos defluvii]|uniref:ABC transporter permease n=1 Tax=Rhodoligotrophos defluvii TaxID=2561934 RepID=UPI0010C9DCCA|nr:ABC transporter permease [Rhodoligotrophos defluvii]
MTAVETTRTLSSAWRQRRTIPGAALLIPVMAVVIAVIEPRFLSLSNMTNLGLQGSMLLMVALPMTLVILTEGLDLSAGAMLSLAGVIVGLVLLSGWGVPAAAGAALLAGLIIGAINGLLIGRFGLPTFVVTLGTLGLAHGAALVLSGGNVVAGFESPLPDFYWSRVLGIPAPVVVALAAYVAFHLLLYRTAFGSYVFALGGNKDALRLAGVRADLIHVLVYVIASVTVAASALLLVGRMASAHPTVTLGTEFDAIAAVVLGGTSFERGRGWLFGTVLGVAAITVLRNGMSLLAIEPSLQVASVGVLVILILLFDRARLDG